ncbi:hypothetical protein [Sphingomonas sp.]|uniref:hypothetical protein n=1 Tax=Sphingomonas sp. TaxID=28214 RepID=UPI0025E9C6D3|nr:hypothetical protein [uncultured Sphingomonas sp.]
MTDRYTDKPFLKLLDCYVLDAIGHLPPDADAELTSIEPHLHRLFEAEGPWRGIVEDKLGFQDGMQGAILEIWQNGRQKFVEAQGHEPDPGEFTRIFIDTNFPH